VSLNANTVLDFFDDTVRKYSGNNAITFNSDIITYSELDELSDRFASGIISKCVPVGSIIALGLYNDIDLIPAVLAIWKANCIYLPIDPNYPLDRIEMMLKEACPGLLITKTELQSKFSFFKGPTYCIDEKNRVPNIELRQPKPGDFAYLMYTSGSTGEPKGIIVEHAALKHAAVAYNELHHERHIALVSGSISFDPHLLVVVSSLAKGGTLCLYDNRDGIDTTRAQEIVGLIKKNSVSFILSTPSFYSRLMQQDETLVSLRNVDLCGEDISRGLIDLHAKFSPNATLYNAYGPTEYAIGVTAGIVYHPKEKKMSRVTIGQPLLCNKVYILDAHLRRVKSGEQGEIYVGGPGLAVGYFKKAKLTEEKFPLVEDLEDHPIRLYRTGDIGCFLPTGEIVFIGRADLQVKINGHRVELEEVEGFIGRYPQIEKVVVLVVQEEKSRLVAFFSGGRQVTDNALREFLSLGLPSYMIPSTFIQIDDWPLTNNGKIDKKALEKSVL